MNFEKWTKSLLYEYQEYINNINKNIPFDILNDGDDEENNFGEKYDYDTQDKIFIKSKNIPNYLTNKLCYCSKCLSLKHQIKQQNF